MLFDEQLTAEEKKERLENLAMSLDEALDCMDEHDASFLAVYKALKALEAQLGRPAFVIRFGRV